MSNSWPTYVVDVGFGVQTGWALGTSQLDSSAILAGGVALGATSWTRVAGFRSARIQRGRADELTQVQAGTMDLLLDNGDGRFSPENQSSPYWPNVLPLRPIRLSALWNGTTYVLFTGFVESWSPVDNGPLDADVKVHAVDWFKIANNVKLTADLPAQDESARIAAIINLAGPPGQGYRLDPGVEPLGASHLADEVALAHIQKVTDAGRGLFFVAADGALVFQNRWSRWSTTRSMTAQATYTQPDATTGQYPRGSFGYVDLGQLVLDDLQLWNQIKVNPSNTGEGEQTANDLPSQQLYGTRTMTLSSDLLVGGRALDLANYLLGVYKAPWSRVPSITLDGDADEVFPGLWDQLLSREISDRIHVEKARPGALGFARDCWIEGIEHDIKDGIAGHTVTWQLRDVRTGGPTPWTLDASDLGGATVLGF